MTDRIDFSGSDPLSAARFREPVDSRRVERDAALERSEPDSMEAVDPSRASELTRFHNMVLQDIDRLRYPAALPDLTAAQAQQTHTSAGSQDPVDYDMPLPSGEQSPAGTDQNPAATGEPPGPLNGQAPAAQGPVASAPQAAPKKYYHGSPEEQLLQAKLDKAKRSGNKAQARTARENLKVYWRKIVDEEYGSLTRESFPRELKRLKQSYKENPNDFQVQYRLHALSLRAKACGDNTAIKEIEKIRNGSLKRSSPTGNAIADYADTHVGGNGHQCYAYVADALESAGIKVWGESAYMAADQLARNPKVREIKGIKADQLSSLPKGAIVVWNHGDGHPDGHISIALGNGKEVSDIVRTQLTDYGTSFRVFAPVDLVE
ncbi:MAG: hypothetical protein RDV48_21005 [Candidatus Eremiobacteraeota bacterium]|nr:hypothetical protein [Candidatus Eremiobacteraeota bacterium]